MKIPKYVYELVELGRLRPAPLDEQANSSIAGQGEDKEHRKPYYKRDYALVTITDPVAQQLEKLIALVSKKH